jgi:alginate O-acetyltransferase complex protein AlgI
MLFTEARFFAFFLIVLGVHWALRSHRLRKLWLLGASYVFYAGWDWRFLSLILVSTCVDFLVGRRLAVTDGKRARKAWLCVSLLANLGLLGFFKYFNFFRESAAELIRWFGFEVHDVTLNIVLPVGISFYTFQTMSYTIDVYRRSLKPISNPFDFALFVAFFPQLVAGPIVRATTFLPQLEVQRDFRRHVAVRSSLMLFLWGFVKKACLADHVSVVVDELFAQPEAYSTSATWIGLAMYHIQVYCDFSGYSDMAIATAGLLGYELCENFRFPYFARNIGEFWRRWHVSLGSWLKDYMYFPLGGGRVSWAKRFRNVYLVIMACGFWHGAGWQFLLFGFLHANYVFVTQVWVQHPWREGPLGRAVGFVSMPLTTFLLFLGWPIFRGESMEGSLQIFRTFLLIDEGGGRTFDPAWGWLFVGCAVVHWVFYRGILYERCRALPHWAFALVYGATWALILPWVAVGYRPFIYFQF